MMGSKGGVRQDRPFRTRQFEQRATFVPSNRTSRIVVKEGALQGAEL